MRRPRGYIPDSSNKNKCPAKGCLVSTKTPSLLGRHLMSHLAELGLKKCKCIYDGCPKEYTQKCNMMAHFESKHLGIRPKCPECGKEYSDKSNLRHHIRSSHEIGANGRRKKAVLKSHKAKMEKQKQKEIDQVKEEGEGEAREKSVISNSNSTGSNVSELTEIDAKESDTPTATTAPTSISAAESVRANSCAPSTRAHSVSHEVEMDVNPFAPLQVPSSSPSRSPDSAADTAPFIPRSSNTRVVDGVLQISAIPTHVANSGIPNFVSPNANNPQQHNLNGLRVNHSHDHNRRHELPDTDMAPVPHHMVVPSQGLHAFTPAGREIRMVTPSGHYPYAGNAIQPSISSDRYHSPAGEYRTPSFRKAYRAVDPPRGYSPPSVNGNGNLYVNGDYYRTSRNGDRAASPTQSNCSCADCDNEGCDIEGCEECNKQNPNLHHQVPHAQQQASYWPPQAPHSTFRNNDPDFQQGFHGYSYPPPPPPPRVFNDRMNMGMGMGMGMDVDHRPRAESSRMAAARNERAARVKLESAREAYEYDHPSRGVRFPVSYDRGN